MAKKSTEIAQVLVRMKEGLREQLETAARRRNASTNSEIVWRLEKSFTDPELRAIDEVATELQMFMHRQHLMNVYGDLVRNVEGLLARLDPKQAPEAAEQVRNTIKTIDHLRQLELRQGTRKQPVEPEKSK